MKRLVFDLELLSDAVLNHRSATEGAHHSLDYIPGSNVLGYVAGRLYNQLKSQESFTIFHSGKVRFGNGLPIFGQGGFTMPIPLSMHREKLGNEQLFNLASKVPKQGIQYKQSRSGYVNTHKELSPSPHFRTDGKVALAQRHIMGEATTTDAKENALFSYESIPAGSRFRFDISFDDSVPEELIKKVKDVLHRKQIRVGRSKSAQYGQAKATLCNEKSGMSPTTLNHPAQEDGEIRILLLSDTALRDSTTGQPTLMPAPKHFGLPETAKLDLARSFIRHRRYSPYNSKRQRPDMERQVLCQGSVLVFAGCQAVNSAELSEKTQAGVGDYRETGLGRILVNPKILEEEKPALKQTKEEMPKSVENDDPLVCFLERKQKATREEKEVLEISRKWAKAMLPYTKAKGGPGPAQWGSLRMKAAQIPEYVELYQEVFEHLKTGVRAHFWNKSWNKLKAVDKLQELTNKLEEEGKSHLFSRILQQTASRVLRGISQKKNKGGE